MERHAEWAENLVSDIDSLYQARAQLAALIQKESELRRVMVSELLGDARGFVEKLAKQHRAMAAELRESLGNFGIDVRRAAQLWQSRADRSSRGKGRPTKEAFSKAAAEAHGKGQKKKGTNG